MSPAGDIAARAYWATAPGRGEIREQRLAAPGDDEVLVRTLWSGVSRGTEALVASGRVPASQWQTMRCPFQEGDFPFPVKYGYAAVGCIEAGPESLLGRIVFCLHPHQTAFVVPATAVTPLPDRLPPERAVLAANLETALNAVWDAGILPGDRVAVIGAGVVGALVGLACRSHPGHGDRRWSTSSRLELPWPSGWGSPSPLPTTRPRGRYRRRGQRQRRRVGPRPGARRLRGDRAGSWLVRRRQAVPAARRGLSQPPAEDRLLAGGCRRDIARRSLVTRPTAGQGHGPPRPIPRSTRSSVGRARFADLPDVMPRILGSAGAVLCHRVRYD